MSKKSLRLILPALTLTGLVAGAFAFAAESQPATASAQEEAGACVAQSATGCYPPEPECIKVDYCTWLCP